MKSTIAVFTAFLALAAVAAAQTEEEANYADATTFVQTFLKKATTGTQSDKETACAKLANDAIDDIKAKCTTQADAMTKESQGKKSCCDSGKKILCAAKKNFDDKTAAYAKCKTDLAALKKAKVSFPSINLDELSPGKCESFFTGNSYRGAKAKAEAQAEVCEMLKGAVESFKKSMDEANNGKKDEVDKCQADKKTAFDTALATAKKTCESEASKTAFTRSKHMLCVLAKKDLKDCKVGDAPSLPEINYTTAKCGDAKDVTCEEAPTLRWKRM